ncbi:MAG: outer membrane lipoprotein LolB [Nitrosomonadales bacterium]|nr:outer membrane lipoprotein LolB [Nitrosomonadales bacterium]
MYRYLLLLLLLTGCASAPVQMQRSAEPDAPFAFNGRVSLKQGAQREKAGVRWVHKANEDEILLLAPLGQTVARIYRDENKATLVTSGKGYRAQDMESLMQQVLGWQLPLSGMRYWIVGQSAPEGESSFEMAASGQLGVLRQQGWVIGYSRYTSDRMDALPLRLSLKREGVEVLLVIDEWELLPP